MKKILLLSLFLFACSHSVQRGPNSLPTDLKAGTETFLNFVQSDRFNADNCSASLHSLYEEVVPLQSNFFDREKALADTDKIMQNLWESRITLRNRLGEFVRQNKANPECVVAIRDALRMARFVEDYVGAAKLGFPKGNLKKIAPAFSPGPYLLLAPGTNKLELKSGDLVLCRGTAYTSSAIAHIGDVGGQFSHLAMVYVDEQTKEVYIVQSLIETGAKIFSLDEFLNDGKVRAVVFRNPDQELAKLAAKKMYDIVRTASSSGKKILYNFTMDLNNKKDLFCSELVEYAYSLAAKEQGKDFDMPQFKTTFYKMSADFLRRMGIGVRETFAPSDMEVDTRFEMVAEWRDFSLTHELHMQDAVLTAMYTWMEKDGYKFRQSPLAYAEQELLWGARHLPFLSKLLASKFPTNIPPNMLGTTLMLNDVSQALYDELDGADAAYAAHNDSYPMSFMELAAQLEKQRIADLDRYQKYQAWENSQDGDDSAIDSRPARPKFHFVFRADN